MFGLPVIVCEILVFNLPKWSQSVKVMSYNVAEYVVGWLFNVQHDGRKFISNRFFLVNQRDIRTNGRT